MVRIAADSGVAIGSGVSGTWGSDVRHHYSKDQPWNSDGTLLALQNNGGGMVLLDGETYQPKLGRCSGYSIGDDRWHPSPAHPHERISVGGTQLQWYDVVNCVKTRSWTLPFAVQYFGPSEGNPSFDGRFAALTDGNRMFVVDMDPQPPFAPYPNSRIGPPVRIDSCGLAGGCAIDWVSISPSGKYAVVSYDGDFPRVFDVDPSTLALTPRPMPAASLRPNFPSFRSMSCTISAISATPGSAMPRLRTSVSNVQRSPSCVKSAGTMSKRISPDTLSVSFGSTKRNRAFRSTNRQLIPNTSRAGSGAWLRKAISISQPRSFMRGIGNRGFAVCSARALSC